MARGLCRAGIVYVVARDVYRAKVIDNMGTKCNICAILINDLLLELNLCWYEVVITCFDEITVIAICIVSVVSYWYILHRFCLVSDLT